MTEVVISTCYGGFGLSWEAKQMYKRIIGMDEYDELPSATINREDPALVEVVRVLGDQTNDGYSNLQIAEVTTGDGYMIEEYDGFESITLKDTKLEWIVAGATDYEKAREDLRRGIK